MCSSDLSYGAGDRLASITGVVRYSFKTWVLCPRSAADLVR